MLIAGCEVRYHYQRRGSPGRSEGSQIQFKQVNPSHTIQHSKSSRHPWTCRLNRDLGLLRARQQALRTTALTILLSATTLATNDNHRRIRPAPKSTELS